jgi:glyoxylase-like metal-dependent hydrolase (beta-lactamase superfamily II)
VIDTGSTAEEGTRLLADVLGLAGGRELVVVNTHAHYDHCFGNVAFQDRETWAGSGCVADLVATGEDQRRQAAFWWRSKDPAFARALESTPIVPAGHQVERAQSLDLGGSVAELLVIGRGHTDHDLVVWLPALETLIAGDLVEASGPPFLLSAHKTPGRDERSFPTWTLPKVAVAVSGLAPRGWLPSRLRNWDWPSHPSPATPALPPE